MPDLIGLFGKREASSLGGGFGGVEQAQLHKRGALRKQREVHACAIPIRTERRGFAGPDGVVVDHGNAGGRNGAAWQRREWGVELTW